MKSISRRVVALGLSAALAGCATHQFTTTGPAAAGFSIRNTKVFAYSFLDLRDAEFGASMLAEVDKQLTQALAKSGVTVKVLRFKDSDVGHSFSATSGGMTVPVRQTIESNAKEEQALRADYRLIIFPSKMTLSGAWKFYDIRWELIEVRTGTRVWSSVSQGKHLTMWKNDEDPEGRAKTIVEGAIGEMKKVGLI